MPFLSSSDYLLPDAFSLLKKVLILTRKCTKHVQFWPEVQFPINTHVFYKYIMQDFAFQDGKIIDQNNS